MMTFPCFLWNLNRCLGCLEQTVHFYSIDEFQSHFRPKGTKFKVLLVEEELKEQ